VILDDLDSDCLAHYLKIWLDKWATDGEVKGGTIPLSYKTFTITSNYAIEDLLGKDPVMAQAVRRRCKVIHMTEPFKNRTE